ncbi:hypothetical protein [Bifidobacterium adolescentis]|uniref:hypothetical protein n=1 Tax=Bifidobacterium adolescentis TaxID=1680 RepID=UPI0022E10CBB|nr:hypothetical protein [Bifidobacterium adolescentis]
MIALVAICALVVSVIGFGIMLGSLNLIDRNRQSGDWLWILGMILIEGGAITILIDIGIGLMT